MTCGLFDIGCHITTSITGLWDSIPQSYLLGAVFLAGMIVGAILGKWGVAALVGAGVAAWVAIRSQRHPEEDEQHEHVPPGPDATRAPKTTFDPRKPLFPTRKVKK